MVLIKIVEMFILRSAAILFYHEPFSKLNLRVGNSWLDIISNYIYLILTEMKFPQQSIRWKPTAKLSRRVLSTLRDEVCESTHKQIPITSPSQIRLFVNNQYTVAEVIFKKYLTV